MTNPPRSSFCILVLHLGGQTTDVNAQYAGNAGRNFRVLPASGLYPTSAWDNPEVTNVG